MSGRHSHEFTPDEELSLSAIDLAAIDADDQWCDAVATGRHPSVGDDPLAALMLAARSQMSADVPAPPTLADLGLGDSAGAAPTTVFPAVAATTAPSTPEPLDPVDSEASAAPVVDFAAHKSRRRATERRRGGWFGPAIIGAAAATLVIVGGGAVVYNSHPGDPLWGVNASLFGNHAGVVELASTLEEADHRNANGDVQGALQLLEQAKAMARDLSDKDSGKQLPAEHPHPTVTQTVTATVTQTLTPEPVAPVTVTRTVTPTPAKPLPSADGLPPGVRPTTAPAAVPPPLPMDDTLEPSSVKPTHTTAVKPPRPGNTQAVESGATADADVLDSSGVLPTADGEPRAPRR